MKDRHELAYLLAMTTASVELMATTAASLAREAAHLQEEITMLASLLRNDLRDKATCESTMTVNEQ